ncbi:MAG: hypothetical protein E7637_00325 [Ruminococcaceae bacterium]|nr:hypothetical protein [Oscillospiraceae bacterium]
MSKRESRHRLTWVDRMLICLLAVGIGLGVWYWKSRKDDARSNATVIYTLCVSDAELNLQEGAESLIPIGSAVTNANGTAVLGYVVGLQARPAWEATVWDEKIAFVQLPNRTELLVRVRADAQEKEGDGFRVRDIRIAAGLQGDFCVGAVFAKNASIIRVEREIAE